MYTLISLISLIVFLFAFVGMIYPFKPFRKRRNALFSFVGSFFIFFYSATNIESGVGTEVEDTNLSPEITQASEAQNETRKSAAKKNDEDKIISARVAKEEEIKGSVGAVLWEKARGQYQNLEGRGWATESLKDEIEDTLVEMLKVLPASLTTTNLEGYQLLAAIRPNNERYKSKVEHYQAQRRYAVEVLEKEEDRVDGVTWYYHPNKPRYTNSRSTVFLYIGRKGASGRPWLRMKVQYAANDWLFLNEVSAWHDGIKEPLVSGSFERDNHSTIWEWKDVSPSDYQLEVLRSLGNAEEAILRFRGQQYHRDVTLSSGDKKALREVLVAYEAIIKDRTLGN